MLNDIRELLPADVLENLSDRRIERALLKVEQVVKTYCNRADIPTELRDVVFDMTVDALKLDHRDANPEANVKAKSIKEGDTSVELGETAISASARITQQLLTDYKTQLQRFRQLRW